MQAYCVKCRSKKDMKDIEEITMRNGQSARRGKCSTCGTKMIRFGQR